MFMMLCIPQLLQAEIIKVSQLEKLQKEKEKKEFSIERDIFSPFKRKFKKSKVQSELPPPPPPAKMEEEEEKVKDEKSDQMQVVNEILQSVAYEGYVMRDSKQVALLTVNGEFFVVGKDDILMEKIKIITVDKKFITVEVDSNVIEINLKGDDENET
jgi:hypothetical protein